MNGAFVCSTKDGLNGKQHNFGCVMLMRRRNDAFSAHSRWTTFGRHVMDVSKVTLMRTNYQVCLKTQEKSVSDR